MKLYEHNGKVFEVKSLSNGHEYIDSPTKPGPGWVQTTHELMIETDAIYEKCVEHTKEMRSWFVELLEEIQAIPEKERTLEERNALISLPIDILEIDKILNQKII